MNKLLRKIGELLESRFEGIYVDLPEEDILPDDEGDIVIDVFNVPFDVEEDFLAAFDRLKKDFLWPKDIYNVLFLPHTPEATLKYYGDRVPRPTFWDTQPVTVDWLKPMAVVYAETTEWWKDLEKLLAEPRIGEQVRGAIEDSAVGIQWPDVENLGYYFGFELEDPMEIGSDYDTVEPYSEAA
jgi:hypothetical protein